MTMIPDEEERLRRERRRIKIEEMSRNIPDNARIKRRRIRGIKKEYRESFDNILLHSVTTEHENFKDYEHEIMSQWEEPYHGERKENNEITDKEIH